MTEIKKLLDYLPPILQEFLDFQALCKAEQPETAAMRAAIQTALDNQFIETADEKTLSRLEKMYGAVSKSDSSLDDRRFALVARLNEARPYTERTLRQMLETLCGEGMYTLAVDNALYKVSVELALARAGQYETVAGLLRRVAPANMLIELLQLYNRHKLFRINTQRAMSAFTHSRLRNEVFD